jgi:sterol desaturase/sphingolipid hydroxylase (fatty acid hydroxylase superfamily)|tara:strand:- start:2810 stop:3718 length:909 start_codon:yes stop_codon:yes gene_type:complete
MIEFLEQHLAVFIDPSERVFFVHLLLALVAASAVCSYQESKFDLKEQLGSLFNRKYWFNRSTFVDYLLLVINALMKGLLIIPIVGTKFAGAFAFGKFLQLNVGDFMITGVPWIIIAVGFSLVLFTVDDVSRFFLHRVMHKYEFLWKFHRVHHSATTLTPFTVFRTHPVESILYFFRGFFVFTFVTGIALWLFRGQLTALEILGVEAFGFTFNMLFANLRHSHIYLSFGRLERWIISPAQHQLHHSRHHGHPNYGACFALWDRLFDSCLHSAPKKPQGPLQFGLPPTELELSNQNKPSAESFA